MPQSLEAFEQECKSVLGYNGNVWDVVQPYAPDPFFTASYAAGSIYHDVRDGVGTWSVRLMPSDPASITASGASLREAILALSKATVEQLVEVVGRRKAIRKEEDRARAALERLGTCRKA